MEIVDPVKSKKVKVKSSRKRKKSNSSDEESEKDEPPKKRQRLSVVGTPGSRTPSKRRQKKVVLLRTGTEDPEEDKRLEKMGATVLKEFDHSVTHILSRIPRRTLKFLCGFGKAKFIVTDSWVEKCIQQGHFAIDESPYFPKCRKTKEFEKEYKINLRESFKRASNQKVFAGLKCYLEGMSPNNRSAYGKMFQIHGGKMVKRLPKKVDKNLIIITKKDNKASIKKLKKKKWNVYEKNQIVISILSQIYDPERFKL